MGFDLGSCDLQLVFHDLVVRKCFGDDDSTEQTAMEVSDVIQGRAQSPFGAPNDSPSSH